jgi:hypothetical protein
MSEVKVELTLCRRPYQPRMSAWQMTGMGFSFGKGSLLRITRQNELRIRLRVGKDCHGLGFLCLRHDWMIEQRHCPLARIGPHSMIQLFPNLQVPRLPSIATRQLGYGGTSIGKGGQKHVRGGLLAKNNLSYLSVLVSVRLSSSSCSDLIESWELPVVGSDLV